MKKLFFTLLLMLCTCMATQAATYSVNDDPVKKIDLTEMIEKAKAEGANWNEDQWKDAYKEVMTAAKPLFKEIEEMQKKAHAPNLSEEDQMKIFNEIVNVMEKHNVLVMQLQEFETIVDANPTAKRVSEDEAFLKQLQEELGVNFDDL